MHSERGVDCSGDGVIGRSGGARREVSREEVRRKIKTEHKCKGGHMSEVTHEQVNLLLRLYDLRRESRLREARDWFGANFHVKNIEDVNRLCPLGSKENTNMRMVLGYWEMVA